MARYEKNTFKKSFRGYSTGEVDEFIAKSKDENEALKEEIKKLERKLDRTEMQLEKYIRAEAVSGDMIANAKTEAEGILSDAKSRAARAIVRAGRQRARIVADMVAQIEEQKNVYDAARREVMDFRAELFRQYGDHIKRINAFAEAAGALDTGADAEELARLLENRPAAAPNIAPPEKKEGSEEPAADVKPVESETPEEPTVPAFEVDEEDIDEFGDGGPRTDAVDEFEGTESLDEVFGKTSSYDELDIAELYGVEEVKPKAEPEPEPAPEPETETKEEKPARKTSPDDDSNEFWSEGDREFAGEAEPDRPTTEVTIVKPIHSRKKKWKLKRSVAASDTSDAENKEND